MRSGAFLLMAANLKYFLFSIFLLSLLLITTDLVLPGHIFWADKNLHQYYITASENPFDYYIPPFCWRITVPLLVYLLPFSSTVSFLFITVTSLLLSGLVLAKILEHYRFTSGWIYLGITLFYSTVFAVRYNLIEFYNPDALLILLMLLGVYFILKDKKYLFTITSIIGVLVKETYLIILPLYYTLNLFKNINEIENSSLIPGKKSYFNSALLTRTFKVSLLPVASFVMIRMLIPPAGDYNYSAILNEITQIRWEYLLGTKLSLNFELFPNQPELLNSLINLYRLTFGTFGGLFILGLIKIKKQKNIFLQFSPLILGAYIQIFFAIDNERLVVIAFLPLLITSLLCLKDFVSKKGINIILIYSFASIYFGVQLILTYNVYFELYYSVAAQIAFTILFLIFIFYGNRYKIIL